MLDLDKKVGNKVMANTKDGGKFVALDNSDNAVEPYHVFIPTGCMNETKRRKRFCDKCLGKFSVNAREGDDVIFLQSLHPLGINRQGMQGGYLKKDDQKLDTWILVKQFGVIYKF